MEKSLTIINRIGIKKVILLTFFFIWMSCNSSKNISNNKISKVECPTDGNCTIKRLNNKSLLLKTDSINGVTYEIVDNKNTNVYVYTYEKKHSKKYQDGSYREEIIFEIPVKTKISNIKNEALQTTKMLFGRFCYCKGYTGYYKIESGNLVINSKNKINTFALDFEVLKVPQVLKKIRFTSKF